MKRPNARILLCILLCLSLISSGAAPVLANSQASSVLPPQQADSARSEDINGEYAIFVLTEGKWQEAGRLGYDMFLREKTLDLSDFLRSSSSAVIRIEQDGGEAAHLDSVFLGGESPQSANFNDGILLGKLCKKDLDLTGIEPEGIELEFPENRSNDVLAVTGRIEGAKISKEPFKFPSSNNYRTITNDSEFYTYILGSNNKKLTLDGSLEEISGIEPIFSELCAPGTGHPEGYTYCWVMNDDEYLYALLDFTPDNTMDGDKDYSKLYVKTKDGVKEFKVSVSETTWGQPAFTYTDKVEYQHKVYEFRIPLAEIGAENASESELAFSAYGTASPGYPAYNSRIHPSLAFDPVENRYLMVYSNTVHYEYPQYNEETRSYEDVASDPKLIPVHGIVGQFVSSKGEEIYNEGSPFEIGGYNYDWLSCASPCVTYGNDMFLVVWLEQMAYFARSEVGRRYYPNSTVLGRFIDRQGKALSETFYIGNSTSYFDDYSLSVAHGGSGSFLVTWAGEDDESNQGCIYSRMVSLSTYNNLPNTEKICTSNYNLERSSVAYSTDSNNFMVVWSEYDEDLDIYGRLLDASGQPIGDIFEICNGEGDQYCPSVTYNSTKHRYFVTWFDEEENSWGTGRIFGRYMNNSSSDGEITEIVGKLDARYEYLSTLHNSVRGGNVSVWYQWDSGERKFGGTVQFPDNLNVSDYPEYFNNPDDEPYNLSYPYLDAAVNTADGSYIIAYPIQRGINRYPYEVDDIKIKYIGVAANDTVQFINDYQEVYENQGDIELSVTRTGACTKASSVKYEVLANSTAGENDYELLGTGTLNFAEGETEQSILVRILDDFVPEEDEYIYIRLFEPSSGTDLGDMSECEVKIIDNDYMPNIRIEAGAAKVSEAVGSVPVNVIFSGIAEQQPEVFSAVYEEETVFSVVYESIDTGMDKGTASPGDDYTTISGSIAFAWENSTKTFYLPIINDTIDENDETVKVRLDFHPDCNPFTNSVNELRQIFIEGYGYVSIYPPETAVITIEDNDDPSTPPPTKRDKSGGSSKAAPASVVVETPPPTEGLPNDALVDRMPGYISLSTPTKINEIKNEISLSYNKDTLANNPGHDARIYYWRPDVKKWVALATYPDGDGKVKAVNDGGYMGWFVVFGVVQPHFSDVGSHWAEQLLNRMNGLGLIEGYEVKGSGLREARPDKKVTRAEFTMFVTRIMNMNPDNILLPDLSDSEIESILSKSYTDAAEITPWVRAAAAKAAKAGLVPFAGSSFKANEPITRIEAAVMVSRALKKLRNFKVLDLTGFEDSRDIPGWAVGEVVENAIEGYPDNTMKPNADIARAESLAMLLRLFIKGLGW